MLTNADRRHIVIATREQIVRAGPDHLDMAYWAKWGETDAELCEVIHFADLRELDYEVEHCGSTACFAGHMVLAMRELGYDADIPPNAQLLMARVLAEVVDESSDPFSGTVGEWPDIMRDTYSHHDGSRSEREMAAVLAYIDDWLDRHPPLPEWVVADPLSNNQIVDGPFPTHAAAEAAKPDDTYSVERLDP